MGYKINGEVIISNSKDIDNVGIATIGLVDGKVSAKAITEQTEGSVSDVTGADEVLIYDAEGGSLLRVTVDEFISGSGIGTLVTDFDNLVVSGVTTTTDLVVSGVTTTTDLHVNNIITTGITTIQDHLIVNDSNNAGSQYNFNVKTSGTSLFGVLGNGAVLLGNNAGQPFIATNDHHATSKKYVDDAISAGTTSLSDLTITGITTVGFLTASNLYVSTGATVYGTLQAGIMTAQWVSGNLQGVLYNSTGNPVLDPDGPGFGGTVYGNVISNVNTGFSTFNNIMVSGMHTAGIITCDYIYGGFSGKIYNNQGNPILNSADASFGGTVYGDLFGDVIAGSSGLSTFKDLGVTGILTARKFEGDGSNNVIIGKDIGIKTTSKEIVSIGSSAGRLYDFSYSTVCGAIAGENNSADNVTFVGYGAGRNNTTGNSNTFIGNFAGSNNNTGRFNTFVGNLAGSSAVVPGTSKYNTFVGYSCGKDVGIGGTNTAMGFNAAARNQTGGYNASFGAFSGGLNVSGSFNVCVGYAAGYRAPSSRRNVCLGTWTGFNLQTGNDNTFVGVNCGYDIVTGDGNIFVGSLAGAGMTGGSDNIYIGNNHGPSQSVVNRTLSIGYGQTAWITGDSNWNIDIPNKLTASEVTLSGGPTWTSGTGSPEGVVTASVGSLFSRTDGGANTSLYVKESGSGNTGWVAK